MDIFKDPSLKLKLLGMLKTRSSREIKASPLSIGFETLDREMFKPDPCYDLVAQAGAKWARCQTGWNRCETTKGIYDFVWLDEVVDQLLKRGVQPWFNLGYGNILYMPDAPGAAAVGCAPTGYGPECVAAWKRFVTAIVRHFAGRVSDWEIWNEPNIDCFWRPTTASGENYAELVALTAPLIRAADPRARTAGCCAGVDCSFVLHALKAGIGGHLDLFSIHPYASIPEQNYAANVASMRRLFRLHAPHIRLWQGECGYPSQTYDHHDAWMGLYHADETTQAKFVARRIVLDSMQQYELIAYFHITDLMEKVYRQASGEARPPVMLGLTHGLTYTPKQSFHAFRNLASVFDADCAAADLQCEISIDNYSLRQSGALPLLSLTAGKFIRHGFPLHAYYCPEDLQRQWPGFEKVTLHGLQETEYPLENPVLIDCLNGRVFAATDWENTPKGWTVRGVPMADYPLILTDAGAIELHA
jgi:hypothetical protein